MPARKIWIYSKYPWSASLRSADGDISWMSLSKSSGGKNDPLGEYVDVIFTDNAGMSDRHGAMDVSGNGQTITVDIVQDRSEDTYLENDGYDLINNDFDLITTV